jgi:hypothetical protein
MFTSKRLLAGASAGALACAALATTAGARMVGATPPQRDSGTSWFAVTRVVNGVDHTAGQVSDKLLGNGAVTFLLKAVTTPSGTVGIKSSSFTLYTKTGSLSGTGSATLTISPSGTDQITNGKLKLTKGTGSLKGAELTGKFSGSGNTTTNQYKVTYKGLLSRG